MTAPFVCTYPHEGCCPSPTSVQATWSRLRIEAAYSLWSAASGNPAFYRASEGWAAPTPPPCLPSRPSARCNRPAGPAIAIAAESSSCFSWYIRVCRAGYHGQPAGAPGALLEGPADRADGRPSPDYDHLHRWSTHAMRRWRDGSTVKLRYFRGRPYGVSGALPRIL